MTQTDHSLNLETKVAGAQGAYDDFLNTFEAFKEANDARLEEIERRMSADVVTEEKVDRINAHLAEQKRALDQLTLKAHRPPLGGTGEARSAQAEEHKAAFETYVRQGEAGPLRGLEAKALSAGSEADGGYLVPEQTETEVGRLLSEASPIRAIAGVRQVSTSVYKKPFVTQGPATGWVAETGARPETASPQLAELQFPAMELYAMPAATQTLLDDSAVNIDQWIAEEVQTAFAEQESAAFISGDGVTQPKGLLTYPTVHEGDWSWGQLGYVPSGANGGFAAAGASDALIDLVYCLKAGYRQRAHWVMNRKTQGEIRKLKDADGNYLWQPAAQAGGQASLMNFPIAEAEDMPDMGADRFALAFGDFSRGYLIVDRVGVRVLRDPYSSKPYVLFYTTKRVGGGVQNFEAVKLMKFAEG
ncbi:MAG: phage major capsid protein [Pseudomonadota bacterium]